MHLCLEIFIPFVPQEMMVVCISGTMHNEIEAVSRGIEAAVADEVFQSYL